MERRAPGRRRKKNRVASLIVLIAILFLMAGFLARRIMAPAGVHYLRMHSAAPSGDPTPGTGPQGEARFSEADGTRHGAQAAIPDGSDSTLNPENITPEERQRLDQIIRQRMRTPDADE